MDLIDRQAAIDICNYAADLWHGQLGEGIVIAVRKRIEQLPAVQPHQIVRCKDCKCFGKIGCAVQIVDESDKPSENDFCSFAERRTDE